MRTFCRGLVTTAGRHRAPQDDLATKLGHALEGLADPDGRRELVDFVYGQSGIRHRYHEALPQALADREEDWIQLVNQATTSLAERSLRRLRDQDPEGWAECDALVVASASYVGFPSLSRVLQPRLELPPGLLGLDLTGLGTAAPSHALYVAWSLLQQGHRRVAVVFADAMATWGLARRWNRPPEVAEVLAHCLASDGAAALLLGDEPGRRPVLSFEGCALDCRTWDDTLALHGLGSREGEPYLAVGAEIRTRLLTECRWVFDDARHRAEPMLLHPGGPSLAQRIAAMYPDLKATLRLSSEVLSAHGNLGAASILFVLQAALREGMPLGPRLRLFALGPGITTTLLRLEQVEA